MIRHPTGIYFLRRAHGVGPAVEQEKVQDQLKLISVKLNEIENRKEPVVAFRARSVKGAKSSSTRVNFNPGEFKSKNV